MSAATSRVEMSRSSDMGHTVRRPAHRGDYLRAHSVRTPNGTVEQQLAKHWRCEVGTAHQRLYGDRAVFKLAADIAEVMVTAGAGDRLAIQMAPLDAAIAGGHVPSLPEALARASELDAYEDLAKSDLHLTLESGKPLTVAQLQEFIKKSAGARHRAEVAERAARVLIDAMEDAR